MAKLLWWLVGGLAAWLFVIGLLALCVRVAGTNDAKWVALGVLALWPASVLLGRERR